MPKRKIRSLVQVTKAEQPDQDIYIREKAILNHQHAAPTKLSASTPKQDQRDKTREWMCENFHDIRTFGAVMATEVNCGRVRGPIQLSFSRSIDRIISAEHAVTRMAVTTEKEAGKQPGDNRTMGRKFTVPWALCRCHGFINPFPAAQTGFGDEDRELLFTALENAFQFEQSAARPAGSMAPRALLVFKPENQLGCAPSHSLFDRLKIESF